MINEFDFLMFGGQQRISLIQYLRAQKYDEGKMTWKNCC